VELASLIIAVIGLAVAIYFGVRAVQKKLTQRQTTRSRSTAIQSGRDTQITNKK
jgi:threonine/homoserine/homoserine lactone efflux protein